MFNNNLRKCFLTASTFVGMLTTTAGVVYAQIGESDSNIGIPTVVTDKFKITDIGAFIGAVVSLLFLIAAILVFVYLVWGGLEWITSGGDKAKTQQAKDRITAALVGLAVVAISYAIVVIAQAFFGVTIIGDIKVPTPFQ